MTTQTSLPLIDPTESIGYLLGQTNLIKDRLLDQHLAPQGITAAQAKVLFMIAYRGQSRGCDIGHYLGVDASTVTRMLDRLEKKGLTVRIPSPEDRRATLIDLTDEGYAIISQSMPLAQNALAELTRGLEPDEFAMLKQLLRKVLIGASGPHHCQHAAQAALNHSEIDN